MNERYDEQLEIQFDGDIVEVHAPGIWAEVWSQVMSRRRALALGAAALGASFVGASSARAKGLVGKVGAGEKIGISFSGLNEYVYNDLTGSLHVLQGTGYRLLVRQSQFDASKQLAAIEDLLAQHISALSVLPSTVQATSNGVLKAKAAGVPCVNQFWSGKTPGDSAYIGVLETDNIIGGRLVANYIMKTVPTGGKILIVEGNVGQGYSEQFTKGIQQHLGNKWHIADIQPGNYVRSTSITVTQNMLTAHPDAKIIVDYATEMGVAVAGYLKSTGRKDILHITSDSNHEMAQWMRNGYIRANRYLSASQTGVLTFRMLRNYLENGKKPRSFVTTQPQRMITAKDFHPNPPPSGVVNKNLDPKDPSFGIYSYDGLLPAAKKLIS